MLKKYIVLVSGNVGGAEKRFFDIFRGLINVDTNIYLVLSSCLLDILEDEVDTKSLRENLIVIQMNKWSKVGFICKFYRQVIKKSNEYDLFHYPLNPLFFFHLFNKTNFTISLCHCIEIPKFSWKKKNLMLQYLASYFALKIDVLSPDIFERVNSRYRHFGKKSYLTPGGTYIYQDDFGSYKKNRKVVFISRLEPLKGINVLFEVIPVIARKIKASFSEVVKFDIYGDGSLSDIVAEKVVQISSDDLAVEFHGYRSHREVLPDCWIVLSLQEITNYPSRVVAESLLSGCEVIVLDTGDSRQFGNAVGINYCSEDLSNLDEVVGEIVRNDSCSSVSKTNNIIQEAKLNYCSIGYINYFSNLLRVR